MFLFKQFTIKAIKSQTTMRGHVCMVNLALLESFAPFPDGGTLLVFSNDSHFVVEEKYEDIFDAVAKIQSVFAADYSARIGG